MKKRILQNRTLSALLVSLLVLLLAVPSVLAVGSSGLTPRTLDVETGIRLTLNGLPYAPLDTTGRPASQFLHNGTTYLPARALSQALGVDIAWKADGSVVSIGRDEAADAARYLKAWFGIDALPDPVTPAAMSAALEKLGTSGTLPASGSLTPLDGVRASLEAAGLKELALTYPASKAEATLKAARISGITGENALYVAAALDSGLMPSWIPLSGNLDSGTASVLLLNTADALGKGRNYLGYTTDPEIGSRLVNAWNSFTLLDEAVLDEVGQGVVEDEATTGYLLTYSGFASRFLPENTIAYDHSDITHARQLVGLLASENITARVALQPKKSVYRYDLAWGPIGDPTPTYRVEKVSDDLYLAHTIGYMLELEFLRPADKAAFDALVVKYAKKSGDNSAAVGVIKGSYWQPQYSSSTSLPAEGRNGYIRLDDVSLGNNGYVLNTFILPDLTDELVDAIEAIRPEADVSVKDVWANQAFHRYLTGESHD